MSKLSSKLLYEAVRTLAGFLPDDAIVIYAPGKPRPKKEELQWHLEMVPPHHWFVVKASPRVDLDGTPYTYYETNHFPDGDVVIRALILQALGHEA